VTSINLHPTCSPQRPAYRKREARHFGAEAIAEGGWRHQETENFVFAVSPGLILS
jgi:hypothetical protein